MPKKSNTVEFIKKAKLIHGENTYDYSLTNYISNGIEVKIKCQIHGIFEQTPGNHLSGYECKKCGFLKSSKKRLSNTIDFIAKAKIVHNDKNYDYSEVNYINAKTKVKIICNNHGLFKQTPANHLSIYGCPKCGGKQKSNTIDFIEKAKLIHKDKNYDYSLVDYVNATTDVKIKCSIHGIFEQSPNAHLSPRGCLYCANNKKSNTIEFIAKAKLIHGENTYDYSLVDYIGTHTKVKIICSEHGIFEQTPSGHLSPRGCIKCSGRQKSNTIEFIEKAKVIHFDKDYDYKFVNYVDRETKVKIICNRYDHGEFEQTPASHLSISGCPKCAIIESIIKRQSNTLEFIKKAKIIHFDKDYDYSETNYINAKTKVKIICPIHGLFEQEPKHHLSKHGCSICAHDMFKSNTIEFITKSKLIHGENRYNYKLVDYIGSGVKVKIICEIDEHGVFEQKPSGHLSGYGCSKCFYKNETETGRCLKLLFLNTKIHSQYNPYPKKSYAVDFYFIYKGKIYIVEYNGLQHYEPALYYHKTIEKANEALIKQQNRDQYGRDQCKENNIILIEIDCREVSFNQIYDYLKNIFKDVLQEIA